MANVVTQWNPFIITNKGLELRQRSIATGATITFNYAKIGQGVPSNSATIPSMTDIISAAEQVPVVRSESDGVTHSVGIRIDNADFEQPVLMTEIGLFASIGQETPVLYGYTYATQGYDSIPAGSTSHYVWTVSIDTVISRAQSISFTYDGSGVYVTEAEMAASLAKKSDVKHTHTIADITDCVEPSNPNLLTNPDFRVNQRVQSDYSSGYSVDGWYIEGNKCTVTPGADGVLIKSAIKFDSNSHVFWQKAENPLKPGKYTLSLNVSEVSGVWSARIRTVNAEGSYVDSYYTPVLHVGVNKVSVEMHEGEYISAVSVGCNKGTEVGDSVKLAWVKLESGSLATPFVPPDYAVELAKCQRYLLKLSQWSAYRAVHSNVNYMEFAVPIPESMRVSPTIIGGDNFAVYKFPSPVAAESDFTFSVSAASANELRVRATKAGHGLSDAALHVVGEDGVLLSAEL